jgi:ribosomal protein L29
MTKARDMTEQERQAALAELRKGPKLEPLDMSKTARDMTESERRAFLDECKRRAG